MRIRLKGSLNLNLEHKEQAKNYLAHCAVLTVSDTRTQETDQSGNLILKLLKEAGHHVCDYQLVKDNSSEIEEQILEWLSSSKMPMFSMERYENGGIRKDQQEKINVIITTGGTGVSRRDKTVEVVGRMLDKELEGFGELFRMLSYQEIGSAAMLSRAVAGLASSGGHETFIFVVPGSTNAAKLAMERLIIPELPHLLWERR